MEENRNIISVQEQKQMELLENGLLRADRFINKNYLINLSENKVIPLAEEEQNTDFIRLFQVEKIVFDKKENINDKLISVYSALQSINSSALLIIDGNSNGVTYYLGVRSNENVATAQEILNKSFNGNFAGSSLKRLMNSDIKNLMNRIVTSSYANTTKNVSCVTVVPAMRDENKDKFVQGMEKFVDTMQGETYTAIYIASPVSKKDLEIRKRGFEELSSSLSPFVKTTLAYGENYSKAVSNGMFENFSRSINNSISNTTGFNTGKNKSYSTGTNKGVNFGGQGMGFSSGTSKGTTDGYSSGTSWSKSVTEGKTDTVGTGANKSDTETVGDSRTLTIEHQNKSISTLIETIDEQLKRIRLCEAFGVWECAAYFIAEDIQTSVVAANTYKALMLGEETKVENSFINVWGIKHPEHTQEVLNTLKYGVHPLVEIPQEYDFDSQYVTPGNFISGSELPLLMGIPHKSVTGLTVNSMAEFGRNVFIQNQKKEDRKITIGHVHHMGKTENNPVELSLDSFTSHCFITGSTGSGKSNTVYCLLEQFLHSQIPFLVVEPAKGEYKTAFGGVENINIFTTNPQYGRMLKINPFRFDKHIHILEHLDRLIEIFNACWEMYAAMPAILKDAMERVYVKTGWDLMNSIYIGEGLEKYPTFEDLLVELPNVINSSDYSSDTKGDYSGALVTRVASLTNGITGQIFCDCYEIQDEVLFDQNTIVDLSRVGSMETKSLIMGLLVLKLNEYRMANANGANRGLRHVTVLEEAHNLLKRTNSTQGQETANLIGKSVEMICNSIAEMRTYGEGFLIVDQSPTSVDIAAIKNTNTKIIMRLPEKSDCQAVGNSVGLTEEQVVELAKLPVGVATIMQNNWLEAVLTRVNLFGNAYETDTPYTSFEQKCLLNSAVINEVYRQVIDEQQNLNLEELYCVIDKVDIHSCKKQEMKDCIAAIVYQVKDIEESYDYLVKCMMKLANMQSIYDICYSMIANELSEYSIYKWEEKVIALMKRYLLLDENKINELFELFLLANCENNEMYYEVYDELFGENENE